MINTSKPFRKFLEFEQYVDEENEVIVSVGQSNMRANYANLVEGDNNGDKSIDESL